MKNKIKNKTHTGIIVALSKNAKGVKPGLDLEGIAKKLSSKKFSK